MYMNDLINRIEEIKRTKVKSIIYRRIKEFKKKNRSNEELFKELCFCILTANYNAERAIKIQNEIGDCFLTDSGEELAIKLANYGHRFPNSRAAYIIDARRFKDKLKEIINCNDKKAIREWFVNNIKGIGYKEASHFLRNVGFEDFAIIDFHIIDILAKYKIIERPKCLSKRKYLEIEEILKRIADRTNLSLAELDLYLWYMETGKVLK